MASLKNRTKGKEAEDEACKFLQAKGLRLLEQNYQCRFGEIDLIMQDKNDIVFVEVRSRHGVKYGNAIESVSQTKVNKLIKTAAHFLQRKKWTYTVTSRFDIIAIDFIAHEKQLEWIKNAFSVDYE